MSKGKNTAFFKGAASLSISVIITKILGVAFKVPLSYVLGDEGMGYFNTAYAIYGFFYILCTAGVPKSITLVISGRSLDGNMGENDTLILKSAMMLFVKIGLFATLINIICAPAFASFVGNKKACLSIITIAPSILFVALSGVLRGYLNTYEKLIPIAVSQLIEGVVKLIIGLIMAFIGVRASASSAVISALAISGITLGSAISFAYMAINVYFKNDSVISGQNKEFNRKYVNRLIVKNALPISLCSSLLNLSSTIDLTIIIKRLVKSGVSERYANSVYGNYTTLAVPMFTLVRSVLAPIATSYMPRLSLMSAKEDKKGFLTELNKLLIITLFISVPSSLAFYFYSFDLLDVLFTVQSSAIGAEALIALSFGIPLLSSLTVINTALESKGKIAVTVISLISGAVTKFAVTYALVGKGNLGIIGAPLGTVISYAVSLCISLFALERNDIKIYAWIKMCVFYIMGIGSFYFPYRYIYSRGILGTSLASTLVALTISCLFYLISLSVLYCIFLQKRCVKNAQKQV